MRVIFGGMMFEVVEAEPAHINELVTLVNSAYRGESSKVGWTTEADLLDGQRADSELIQGLIKHPLSKVLLLKEQPSKRIIGCVHLEKLDKTMYLGMLVIMPGLQAKGFGKELLRASEKQAQQWQCRDIEMTVISVRKELIAWYEKQGFIVTHEKKPFPSHDPRFGIPKVENLEFVVLRKPLSLQ